MLKLAILAVLACAVQGRDLQRAEEDDFDPNSLCLFPFASAGEPFWKPYDCNFFYQCSNGILHTMPCAPGTAFNPKVGVCDWPGNVVWCNSAAVNTVHICEHANDDIKCPRGTRILISDGFYGRKDSTTCANGPIKTTECSAEGSLQTLQDNCNGRRRCSITASNRVFGDPCVGTFKYVEVSYFCDFKSSLEADDDIDDQPGSAE